MSELTPLLEMPFIMPAQAQKHVTHNEALQKLDCLVQLVLLGTLQAPPASPAEGDGYLVGETPSGAWQGKSGKLAFLQDNAWQFTTPRNGWRAWFAYSNRLMVLTESGWKELPLPENGRFQTLGIEAEADETNRLAISAPSSLFNNAGEGHQIKINKAAATDTASLLFQSDWSGHAEMGLAGSNAFTIKVSPDGAHWNTGLEISESGKLELPNRPLAVATLAATNMTVTGSAVSGFSLIEPRQGGFALGEDLAGATGKELLVPASGLYMTIVTLVSSGTGAHSVALVANGIETSVTVSGAPSAADVTRSVSSIITLSEGDRLTFAYSGSADIAFGAGKTGLGLIAL